VPLTREQVREAVERAGDEHWQALIRHHEDAYPESRPTPGDICRLERTVRITHLFEFGPNQAHLLTEPFEGYS